MKTRVACVTTSRADFGIYLPLLKALREDEHFELEILAGGMHTSERFGNSYKLIEKAGFEVGGKFMAVPENDSTTDIACSIGKISNSFAEVVTDLEPFHLFLVLGDRYEMFAAAAALVPFQARVAHFHGGEVTLGAIDNKFRHAITMLSDLHFCSNSEAEQKLLQMTDGSKYVYNVGAMGIDNMVKLECLSPDTFMEKFGFNIDQPFILTTYHPETVELANREKGEALIAALKRIKLPVLCTLPNADTEGTIIREMLLSYERDNPAKIKCVENLGQVGYLTAMKHCLVMVGNTSSGIIEAATFDKPVVNIGNRQTGRLSGENVFHCENNSDQIYNAFCMAEKAVGRTFRNPYGEGNSASRAMKLLNDLRMKDYFYK